VGGAHQGGDDLAFTVISGCVEHHRVDGNQAAARDGVLFGPACGDSLGDQVRGEHGVKALVSAGMEVGELSSDHEGIRGCARDRFQPQGPGTGDRNHALAFANPGEGEQLIGEELALAGALRLLVELGVRVRGSCAGRRSRSAGKGLGHHSPGKQ